MQKFILAELDRRFEKAECITPLAVATILDPRFKKIYFQSALATSRAINFISGEMKKDFEKNAATSPTPEAKPDEASSDSIWAFHDEFVKTKQQGHSDKSSGGVPIELDQYLKRPILSMDKNPFEAWELMKSEFPNLYQQAMRYLPVTATSVPSERLFSEAKLVLSDLRSRLTPEHFSQLLFLASISPNLWNAK